MNDLAHSRSAPVKPVQRRTWTNPPFVGDDELLSRPRRAARVHSQAGGLVHRLWHLLSSHGVGSVVRLVLAASVLLLATDAWAQAATAPGATGPSLPLMVGQGPNGNSYSVPIQTLLFFTALSFLPAMLLLMTGFTRIVIVLSLMRQALGTQSAPPNQVVVGLSLFLTFFVMGPTLDKVYQDAYAPYSQNAITFEVALERGQAPMRAFMLKQTRQSDFELFANLARLPNDVTAETAPFRVLVPAFVTSELKTAFQIGFMIFIPFLVIDMVVASVLMSLGMMMLSPVLVALPFKLMLFVLADGWNLLIGSLAASFAQ
jgi:flagellar biosynthetic protein FliP